MIAIKYTLLLVYIDISNSGIFGQRQRTVKIRAYHENFNPKSFFNSFGPKDGIVNEFVKPAILPLNEYISPLESHHCLVLLDNFQNVDILPPKLPVMQRRYVRGEITTSARTSNPFYVKIWTVPELHNFTCSLQNLSCVHSPKFARIDLNYARVQSLCTECNRINLATFSKLWNCEAHFSLYSPIKHYKSIFRNRDPFPEMFDYIAGEWEFRKTFPSSLPVLNIFVMNPTNHSVHSLARQVAANDRNRKYLLKNQLIIYIVTSAKRQTFFVNIHTPNSAFILCLYCKNGNYYLSKYTDLPKSEIHSKDLLDLKYLSTKKFVFQLLGTQLKFDVFGGIDLDKIDDEFKSHFLLCWNKIVKNQRFSLAQYTDALDLIMSAYVHEWHSIFQNYSYGSYAGKTCESGRLHDENSDTTTDQSKHFEFDGYLYKNILHNLHSIALEDKITTMKFVSCGRRSYSLLPFQELSNVFNKEVWIAVLVSIFLLPILPILRGIGSVGSFETYLKYFDATFRILIGLDNPLNETILKRHSVRYVILGFALAALVLNNAYKSDNVYRMTLPRNIVPYTNFSDLVQNKFTVYTQLSYVALFSEYPIVSKSSVFTKKRHIFRGKNLSQVFEIQSQLHATGNVNSRVAPNLDKLAYNYSDIHDEVQSIAEKLGYPWDWDLQTNLNFRNNLFRLDEQVLLKKLSSCKNIALVLPTYQCQQFAVTTKRDFADVSKFVDVGEETYFKSHHVFTFKGVVPPYLIVRVKSILASGVFEWWQEIALLKSKYIGRSSREQTLEKPNLSGNILVVFVILLGGLALGLVCMLLECLSYMFGAFKYIWYFVALILKNFVRKVTPNTFNYFRRRNGQRNYE